MPESVAMPLAHLSIGVTGHRITNPMFATHEAAVREAVAQLCGSIEKCVAARGEEMARPRLHSLLAFGADAILVEEALARGWKVIAPLPFGLDLNLAINVHPETPEDAAALIDGAAPADPDVAARAATIRGIAQKVQLFELAEQDALVGRRFLDHMRAPGDAQAAAAYAAIASERSATAGRIMIEQSDLIIAIWDGVTPGAVGGTRHTIAAALAQSVPVLWIDVRDPQRVRVLQNPEALDAISAEQPVDDVEGLIQRLIAATDTDRAERATRFHTEKWHARSSRRFHAYRRIEAIFGGPGASRFGNLVQSYETAETIAQGSGANLLASARALPGADQAFADRLGGRVFARFAWADGLSTYLSDAYRGGMVMNFLLSALAIVIGVAYLPFASIEWKWPFALAELLLLLGIVAITATGRRRRWHGRWFETRRVAEYLRHAPILLLLGVTRPGARWPRGANTQWPEQYARQVLREVGLPRVRITAAYLRSALVDVLGNYVRVQRDYHRGKAARLAAVHHNIDRLSEILFILAIISVSLYLVVTGAAALGLVPEAFVAAGSKQFTFLGILLPAVGGAFAGIRYFGDFERFSAISEVTAEKLDEIDTRIARTLAQAGDSLNYAKVADLAHAMDDVVVAEIESWQSVFAAKNIAVPV